MGEASSVPQLARDHPLAVLRTRPEPLQGALVDLDVVVEVAVGVDFPVVVTGLVTWPAAAVNRHLRGLCTRRRRSSRGRNHKEGRYQERCPLRVVRIADSGVVFFFVTVMNCRFVLIEPLLLASVSTSMPSYRPLWTKALMDKKWAGA